MSVSRLSTEKGLVVPVLRDADEMSLAKVEDKVRDFGLRARDGKLGIDEMTGGTFTITNGGVFGSLLSNADPQPAADPQFWVCTKFRSVRWPSMVRWKSCL